MNRLATMTAAALLGLSATGINAQPVNAADHTTAQRLLRQLEGEFEGQIEVRKGDQLSASVACASNRLTNAGELVCAFEGFAFGQMHDGAFAFNAQDSSCAWTTDLDKAGTRTTFTVDRGGVKMVATQGAIEQVTTVLGRDMFTIEWFDTSPDNPVSIRKLTFERVDHPTTAGNQFADGSVTEWSAGALHSARAARAAR